MSILSTMLTAGRHSQQTFRFRTTVVQGHERTSMRMRKIRHWMSFATPPHTLLCRLASMRPSTDAARTKVMQAEWCHSVPKRSD